MQFVCVCGMCVSCIITFPSHQAIQESGSFNAQELSIIFWSLAKLQHEPPAPWVARLLREGLEVAGGMTALSLVLLLGSLTRWALPEMHTAGHYR